MLRASRPWYHTTPPHENSLQLDQRLFSFTAPLAQFSGSVITEEVKLTWATHRHIKTHVLSLDYFLYLFVSFLHGVIVTAHHNHTFVFFLSSRTFYFILAPPMVLLGDFLIILYKLEKASFFFFLYVQYNRHRPHIFFLFSDSIDL